MQKNVEFGEWKFKNHSRILSHESQLRKKHKKIKSLRTQIEFGEEFKEQKKNDIFAALKIRGNLNLSIRKFGCEKILIFTINWRYGLIDDKTLLKTWNEKTWQFQFAKNSKWISWLANFSIGCLQK